jgi:hypothetical protein
MDAFAWPISVTVFFLVIFVALLIRFPREIRGLLGRFVRVNVGAEGFAIEFMAEAVAEKEDRQVSRQELAPVAARLGKLRVLWVDDMPENNRLEAQALRALGGEVDFATSNAEAAAYAQADRYDIVVSDIGRQAPQASDDGLRLPERLASLGLTPHIVYYVGRRTAPTTPDGHPVYDQPSEFFDGLADLMATVRQA